MSRLMSVAYTEQAVVERRKFVTRRIGWWKDKNGRRLTVPGDRLTLCRKVMGRKKGEPLVRLALVEVVDVRRERLDSITHRDVALEGFPELTPRQFVQRFFCDAQGIAGDTIVTRIQWRYVDETAVTPGDAQARLFTDHPHTIGGHLFGAVVSNA